jgi:hypothetical protein
VHATRRTDLEIRSTFNPWFFLGAAPVTALVWAQPRNRAIRWLLNTVRAAFVLYLVGLVVATTVKTWT